MVEDVEVANSRRWFLSLDPTGISQSLDHDNGHRGLSDRRPTRANTSNGVGAQATRRVTEKNAVWGLAGGR